MEKAIPAAAPKRKVGLPLAGGVAVLFLLAVVGGVVLLRGRGAPATETPTARAVSVIAMPTETEPAVIGDGRIVFTSERDGNGEIYVMNADGSGLTRLTNNPARDIEPSWSPDGRRMAFISGRDDADPEHCPPECNWEVYVMGMDGDRQTRLTYNSVADDVDPVWAPQCMLGECPTGLIAFQSNRDGNWEIYVVDALTGEERRMTYNLGWDENPYWSPDGKWIASASTDQTVKVWDATNGQEAVTLKGHTHRVAVIVFSPDWRRLASANETGMVKVWDAPALKRSCRHRGE